MGADRSETESRAQRRDADGDGMPDMWNQRMPAIAFVSAMLALIPALFAMRASIAELRRSGSGRSTAFTLNIVVIVFTTAAIICSAYGERAKTAGLAKAARKIAIVETVIAVLLIIVMFFKTS